MYRRDKDVDQNLTVTIGLLLNKVTLTRNCELILIYFYLEMFDRKNINGGIIFIILLIRKKIYLNYICVIFCEKSVAIVAL